MYHLFKQTRIYHGRPYCGPTSNNQNAEYSDLKSAQHACELFTIANPVGWNIYDATTGELVEGIDNPISW